MQAAQLLAVAIATAIHSRLPDIRSLLVGYVWRLTVKTRRPAVIKIVVALHIYESMIINIYCRSLIAGFFRAVFIMPPLTSGRDVPTH